MQAASTREKTEVDQMVPRARTPDVVTAKMMTVIPQSKAPKDKEEWVARTRQQVIESLARRGQQRDRAHSVAITTPIKFTEEIRRLSAVQRLAKRRHDKDKRSVLSDQLNQAARRGEVHEAHRLARLPAGKRMDARRRWHVALPASRSSVQERPHSLLHPISKGDAARSSRVFRGQSQLIRTLLYRWSGAFHHGFGYTPCATMTKQ